MKIIQIFILGCFFNFAIFAGGTDFNSINSSRALALGGFYIAGNNGVSGIITNPAGLIYLNGSGLELTVQNRLGQQEFNSSTKNLFQSYRNDDFIAEGGAFLKLSENAIIGISYGNIINYSVSWPYVVFLESDSANAVLSFEFANRIKADAISPAAAFKFGNFTFGLSANVYRVTQHTAFPIRNERWDQNIGDAAYQFTYDQDAWSYGFTFGILADLSENLTIGANVKSGFKAELEGEARSEMFAELDSAASEANLSGNFELPWTFGLGLTYKLSESIRLNIDGIYSLWEKTSKTFDYDFDNNLWQNKLSQTDALAGINASSFPLFFNNTFDAGFGIEYKSTDDLAYRLGYRFSQSPNSEITYSMLFPSVDRHSFSIGIVYRAEKWHVDGALVYSVGITKSISSNIPNLIGKYDYNLFIPSITLLYKL